MTDERPVPWWYSGDEPDAHGATGANGANGADDSQEAGAGAALDWLGLLSGAVRMVDWAAGAVLEPHAGHQDPAEHPDCLVCRTVGLVSDRTGLLRPSPQTGDAEAVPAEPIRWITVHD